MLARLLLVALAALATASGVSAQCTTGAATEVCTEVYIGTATGVTLSATLTYDATNQICSVSPVSSLNSKGNAGTAYQVVLNNRPSGSPTVNTVTPSPAGTPNAPLLGINLAFTGNLVTAGAGATVPSQVGSFITTANNNALLPGTLVFPAPGFTSTSGDATTTATTNVCTAISGDPLFSGFRGQQFYVGGEDGQVMNMISTFNMQLNGRFVTLNEGQAITPDAQKVLRLNSLLRQAEQPELAAFPETVAWTHPGNYFGEVGVALLDENRLYAKAGSYESGFAKVAMNGRPLAVSSEFVVLGQGANTTYIQRVSAHELMVRTVNVEFTITNSDNFINIEHVHLEKGFRQHNRFGGLLGKTVDAQWQWNKADEEAAVVQTNDLFAKEQ